MFEKPSEALLYRCSSFLSQLLTTAKDCGNFAAKYSMTELDATAFKLLGMLNNCDNCGRKGCMKGFEITNKLLPELKEGSKVMFSPNAGADLKGRKGKVVKYFSGKLVVEMGSVTTCYNITNNSDNPMFLFASCKNEN